MLVKFFSDLNPKNTVEKMMPGLATISSEQKDNELQPCPFYETKAEKTSV